MSKKKVCLDMSRKGAVYFTLSNATLETVTSILTTASKNDAAWDDAVKTIRGGMLIRSSDQGHKRNDYAIVVPPGRVDLAARIAFLFEHIVASNELGKRESNSYTRVAGQARAFLKLHDAKQPPEGKTSIKRKVSWPKAIVAVPA